MPLFFQKEMQARRIADGRSISSLTNWLYEIIADYGYDFGRACSWWAGHFLISTFPGLSDTKENCFGVLNHFN